MGTPIKIAGLAVLINAAFILVGLGITNFTSTTEYYGGSAGFLPQQFHVLMAEQSELGTPAQTSGFGFFKWGASSGFCKGVNFITGIFAMLTLQYAHVTVLQGEDILNWLFIGVTMVGYFLFLGLLSYIFNLVLPIMRSPQAITMVLGGSAVLALLAGFAELTSIDVASAVGCIPQ